MSRDVAFDETRRKTAGSASPPAGASDNTISISVKWAAQPECNHFVQNNNSTSEGEVANTNASQGESSDTTGDNDTTSGEQHQSASHVGPDAETTETSTDTPIQYWRYGSVEACDPKLYGGMSYMTTEHQSYFSRWAVFERSSSYHTLGSSVTRGALAHKPYTKYVVLACDWFILQTMQPDWHRGAIRVHVLCDTATVVHCSMAFCRCTHWCTTHSLHYACLYWWHVCTCLFLRLYRLTYVLHDILAICSAVGTLVKTANYTLFRVIESVDFRDATNKPIESPARANMALTHRIMFA